MENFSKQFFIFPKYNIKQKGKTTDSEIWHLVLVIPFFFFFFKNKELFLEAEPNVFYALYISLWRYGK